ncbi:MAG: hypothetical protein JWN52_4324 [Actinomycetia bacterium]|nr:hypothetical protein [Actinomycetes bacterium]
MVCGRGVQRSAARGLVDLVAGGLSVAVRGPPGVDERGGLHHEARSAEPALQPVVGGDGALHGMHF